MHREGIKHPSEGMTTYLCATRKVLPIRSQYVAATETQVEEDILTDVVLEDEWNLVLFNDNHNTFDHVINCLVDICGHDALQAEQCAMVVHFKGKCTVKSGEYDELAPIFKSLSEKDLTVELNA